MELGGAQGPHRRPQHGHASRTYVYETGVPLNVTRLAGLHTTIIGTVGSGKDADLEGLSRGDSQTWSELGDAVIVETQDARRPRTARLGRALPRRARSSWATRHFRSRCRSSSRRAPTWAPSASGLKTAGAAIAELVEGFWREWKEQLA